MNTILYNGHMKKIPLTPEGFAIVDDEDYEELSKWAWHRELIGKGKHKNPYARRGTSLYGGVKKSRAMHRLILSAPDHLVVDHINHDTLDNRKSNLRLCTAAQNSYNRVKYRNNTSEVKGVHEHKPGKWRARIQVDGKRIHLGIFTSLDDAKQVYEDAAKKYYKEFRNGHTC